MAEQPRDVPIGIRLKRLGDAFGRAVHVAATLRMASSGPEVQGRSSRRLHRVKKFVVTKAELTEQSETPGEVQTLVRGLESAYARISSGSARDKQLLLRQFERQIGDVTDEINNASDLSIERVNELRGAKGTVSAISAMVEQVETDIRIKVDRVAADVVPIASPHGVLTGLVANRICGQVVDDTLSRAGQALVQGADVPAPPIYAPAEIAAPAEHMAEEPSKEIATRTDDISLITPWDLDTLDPVVPSGSIKMLPDDFDEGPRALPDGPQDGVITSWPAEPSAPTGAPDEEIAVIVEDEVAEVPASDRDVPALPPAAPAETPGPARTLEPAKTPETPEPAKTAKTPEPAKTQEAPAAAPGSEPAAASAAAIRSPGQALPEMGVRVPDPAPEPEPQPEPAPQPAPEAASPAQQPADEPEPALEPASPTPQPADKRESPTIQPKEPELPEPDDGPADPGEETFDDPGDPGERTFDGPGGFGW